MQDDVTIRANNDPHPHLEMQVMCVQRKIGQVLTLENSQFTRGKYSSQ